MDKLQSAAAFGRLMGKKAAEGVQPMVPGNTPKTFPTPAGKNYYDPTESPTYDAIRNAQIEESIRKLHEQVRMAREAAGASGPGVTRATMKGGVIQPGAKFTPQQPGAPIDWSSVLQPQRGGQTVPGAGGQQNIPPVPRGPQNVPPATSPVIESKTPRKLF